MYAVYNNWAGNSIHSPWRIGRLECYYRYKICYYECLRFHAFQLYVKLWSNPKFKFIDGKIADPGISYGSNPGSTPGDPNPDSDQK